MLESDILATTFYHSCTIRRKQKVRVGSFDQFESVVVASGVPCAVSFSGGSTQGESDTFQAIEYLAQLFVRPEVDVRAGDEISADVHGEIYEFLAAEGVKYPSHRAVSLIRKDRA